MRAHVGACWIPYALWAFVLVEFGGTSLTDWASLASGLLFLTAFAGLAVAVWRSPIEVWLSQEAPGDRMPARNRDRVPAR